MAKNQIRGDLSMGNLVASYNGFSFSPTMETVGCSVKCVYDRAGRAVVRKIFTLTIKDRLQADAGIEASGGTSFGDIRKTLEQPGGALIYENFGLGGKAVNGGVQLNSNQHDVDWGPKPQMVQWRQLGAGNAIEFIWTVEFSVLDAFKNTGTGIMEFNYTLSWAIDVHGLTRRTYSGYLRIAQTRKSAGDRSLPTSADAFMGQVVPPLLTGFRRIPGERTIDESKNVINFSVTDEELPSTNVPPEFCTNASASHSLETDGVAMLQWHGTIEATYELVKGVTPAKANEYFLNLVKDRLVTAAANTGAQAVIPVKLSVRENNLYGTPSASFSLSYTYTSTLSGLLGIFGMWRPATDSDWKKWSASLKGSAFNSRGIAGCYFSNSDDAIVDLGSPTPTVPKTQPANITASGKLKLSDIFTPPSADQSWIDYQNNLQVLTYDETAVLKPLPQQAVTFLQNVANVYSPAAAAVVGFVADYAVGQVAAINQKRCQPTYFVDFSGRAIRAGYEIKKPQLLIFGGSNCTPANARDVAGFKAGVVANWGGIPIYAAMWHLRWVLDKAPTSGAATVTKEVPNLIYTKGKIK